MSEFVANRAKMLFANKLMSQTAGKIYAQQEQTAADWNLFDSGNLTKSLAGQGHFSVKNDDFSVSVSLRYLAYTRFLDMKDPRRSRMRQGYHLYNRILYWYLYNELLPGLKTGYTPEIKEQMEAEIKMAMDAGYID